MPGILGLRQSARMEVLGERPDPLIGPGRANAQGRLRRRIRTLVIRGARAFMAVQRMGAWMALPWGRRLCSSQPVRSAVIAESGSIWPIERA
jgi:hypothetical protein